MVHTTHPEAIARHRFYIQITRIELRKEARDKLHRMLIEASHREHELETASWGQDQASKEARVSSTSSDMQTSNSMLTIFPCNFIIMALTSQSGYTRPLCLRAVSSPRPVCGTNVSQWRCILG